jgi:hypothetical protein
MECCLELKDPMVSKLHSKNGYRGKGNMCKEIKQMLLVLAQESRRGSDRRRENVNREEGTQDQDALPAEEAGTFR